VYSSVKYYAQISIELSKRGVTMAVILYEHINFRGKHKHVIDRDEPDLHKDGWGDRISSIQVLSGTWQFCQHVNYGGWSVNLGPGNYPWVEDFGIPNDNISSLRRISTGIGLINTPGLIIYEHIDFKGDHKHIIDRDESSLHPDGWGDRLSSFQIISGRWRFFQHVDYSGWSNVLGPGNYRWVEQVGISNDQISSIRREEAAVVIPDMQSVETILYEHIDFRGDHKHLINHGQKNLHTDGWGDRVSSIQVLSGNRWTFHEHVDYAGASINLGPGSYRWIVDAGMANDRLSSVRANIVPIFFKIIQGATTNIPRDLRIANQVFNQYGIEFFQLEQETNNAPALLDLDQPTCFMGQSPTNEESQLYSLERDHAPSDIVVYYLRSTNLGVRGCAACPITQPGSVVTDGATQFTMAHEIGHVLGLAHVASTTANRNNLMFPNTGQINVATPILTNAQQNTVRQSQYLV